MPAAKETHRAGAVAPCGAALPRAAAFSLATLMALNVVTPAAWAEAAPRTASAAGAPELSAHEVDEHVSVLDPLLTAAGSGLDALEEALAGVLAPATAEADEAPADVTLPELETAFESVPGGANARILLDLPCVRAAYAHTLPGGGWSPVRENFGSRAYASGLGAQDGEASALLALFVAPEDDSLWVSAPESPTGAVFSVDAVPATLPPLGRAPSGRAGLHGRHPVGRACAGRGRLGVGRGAAGAPGRIARTCGRHRCGAPR